MADEVPPPLSSQARRVVTWSLLAAVVVSVALLWWAAGDPDTGTASAGRRVALAGGTYVPGLRRVLPTAPEPRPVTVAPFELDATEVAVTDYRRCVEAGLCPAPGSGDDCA